ncbi:dTDP-4-dehydrorhamnose 3,5-epimerase family protein [soil metagenome]
MNTSAELLPGTLLVTLRRLEDARGSFVKTFAHSALSPAFREFEMREEFYSTSAKDVIRGMHFQLPPHDHAKLVYCPVGAVLDVLLDLRAGPGYGALASTVLSAEVPSLLLIPRGVAHGFRSLEEGSLMVYKTSTEHERSHDVGIRWDSFGFDWGLATPILSARDAAHPSFASFTSPF